MKHSKLPWRACGDLYLSVEDGDGKDVCVLYYTVHYGDVDIDNYEANAEFICKAVNHHQELVDALESLLESADKNDVVPNGFYEYKELLNKIKGE